MSGGWGSGEFAPGNPFILLSTDSPDWLLCYLNLPACSHLMAVPQLCPELHLENRTSSWSSCLSFEVTPLGRHLLIKSAALSQCPSHLSHITLLSLPTALKLLILFHLFVYLCLVSPLLPRNVGSISSGTLSTSLRAVL